VHYKAAARVEKAWSAAFSPETRFKRATTGLSASDNNEISDAWTINALLLAALRAGVAQAQSITCGLYGKEPGGKEMTIEVSGNDTGYHRELHPDDSGRYSVVGLNPGKYTVTV
jgi:hypothetical protein